MELKESIKKQLNQLKQAGFSRADLEKRLGLAENSIDQNLARGGTKKLHTTLQLLIEGVLHNASESATGNGTEKPLRAGSPSEDTTDYRQLYMDLLKKENEEKSEIIKANLTAILANLSGLSVGSKMLQAHLTTALEYYALEIAEGDKKRAEKIKGDMDTRVIELLAGEIKKSSFSGVGK